MGHCRSCWPTERLSNNSWMRLMNTGVPLSAGHFTSANPPPSCTWSQISVVESRASPPAHHLTDHILSVSAVKDTNQPYYNRTHWSCLWQLLQCMPARPAGNKASRHTWGSLNSNTLILAKMNSYEHFRIWATCLREVQWNTRISRSDRSSLQYSHALFTGMVPTDTRLTNKQRENKETKTEIH